MIKKYKIQKKNKYVYDVFFISGSFVLFFIVPFLAFMGAMSIASNVVFANDNSNTSQSKNDVSEQFASESEIFAKANSEYQHGNYDDAEKLYLYLVSKGIKNGHLYYNLGNTYQRKGDNGLSIYYYRKASLDLPRDADVEANLSYARLKTKDSIEYNQISLVDKIAFWNKEISDFELFSLAMVFNLLFWLALSIKIFLKRRWVNPFLAGSGFLAFIMISNIAFRTWKYSYEPDAVVLNEEVSVRSGIDVNSVRLFVLHSGAEVRTLQRSSGWTKIELPDGKQGWVQQAFIGLISP